MPSFTASSASRGMISTPSSVTVPASRWTTPVTALISVDLPAPFSPSKAWISPECSVRFTPLRTRCLRKLLVKPATSSRGRASSGREAIVDTFQQDAVRTAGRGPAAPDPWLQSVAKTLLAVIDLLRIVGRRVEFRIRLDPLRRHRSLFLECNQRIEGRSRHVRRQLDRRVRLARHERLENVGHRVDRNNEDVLAGLEACFFDRLNRADGHVVVMGIERADILAAIFGLQEAFGDFFALGAGEIAGLAPDHLDVGMLCDRLIKPLLAIGRDARSDGALQFDHVAWLAADIFRQPLTGDHAFMNAVGCDGGQIERLVRSLDVTIEQDDRNLGVLGLVEHSIPARRNDRREETGVNALRDERANGLDLVLLLLLSVGDL